MTKFAEPTKAGSLNRLVPSFRFTMALLMCGSSFIHMASLCSMNFTITCMVNSTMYSSRGLANATGGKCRRIKDIFETAEQDSFKDEEFDDGGYSGVLQWSRSEQSAVLAGTPIGAIAVVFISGYFTDKYGAYHVGSLACFLFAISALVLPLATRGGWLVVTVIRIVQGFGVMAGWPLYLVMANRWFPIRERGLLMSIGLSGFQLGLLSANWVASYCCNSNFGWSLYFYLLAGVSGLFLFLWMALYTDHVESAKFISQSEVNYILRYRGHSSTSRQQKGPCINSAVLSDKQLMLARDAAPATPYRLIPWGHIFRSPVIWSLLLVTFCGFYQLYFMTNYMPSYYKEKLGIDVGSSGLLSSLPSVAYFVGRLSSGPIADRLDRFLGQTPTIKVMTAVAVYGPAVLLAVATVFDCNQPYGAVICFTLSCFLYGYGTMGFMRAALLVTPDFVGTVAGMLTTANFSAGFVVPYMSGAIIGSGSDSEWHWAFYAAAGFGVIGTTVFLILGAGEPQPWANTQKTDEQGVKLSHQELSKGLLEIQAATYYEA